MIAAIREQASDRLDNRKGSYMSDTADDNSIEPGVQDQIRAEVKRLLGKRPMTAVAQEMDVAYGTFSSWMGCTYAGNTSKIARKAQIWIDAQGTKKQLRTALPRGPGFDETPTARRFISALETAQYEPCLALIAGDAGVGKTTALARYRDTNPNVWILTGEPCFATPRMLLDLLAEAVGITEKYSSQKVSSAIQRRIRGTGGLIVVDEAQHLSSPSLDQMRTIYDLSGVGVALVGNQTVYARLEGRGREAQFAQLFSRVGLRVNCLRLRDDDISTVLDACNVTDAGERRVLTAIGKKAGALRNIAMTLRRAAMLAADDPVTADVLRRAWENISGTKLVADAA